MSEAKTISVVMAASDFYAHTPELFQSLDAQSTDDFHMIVVDDGSTEGCELGSYDRAMVLRNMKRLGFGRALNQALSLSLARWEDADLDRKYILIIQPEVILQEKTLSRLLAACETQPDIMVAAPTVFRALRTRGIEEDWELDFTDEVLHAGFAMTKSREIRWVKDEAMLFAPAPECFMMRASFLKKLQEGGGYIDEQLSRFPALVDFLWRAKLMGGRMECVSDANAWKQQAESSGKKLREALRSDKQTQLELQDVHVKLSPYGLRAMHAPWLLLGWVKRFFSILASPTLWGVYLRKPVHRFRVAKERSERLERVGVRSNQMKNWFV